MSLETTRNWERLFERDYIKDRIMEITEKYPKISSLSLSARELLSFDIWDSLIEDPDEVLKQGLRCMNQKLTDSPLPYNPEIPPENLHIRPKDGDLRIAISEIRQQHIGRLLELKGIVRRCTKPELMIVRGRFKCRRCGHEFDQELIDRKFMDQVNCPNPNCHRDGPFKLIEKDSIFVDTQGLTVQETFDELDDGHKVPQSIEARLQSDIVNQAKPGDRVRVTGILRIDQKQLGGRKPPIYTSWLDCLCLEQQVADYGRLEISDDDERALLDEANRPDHIERMTKSIASSISGMERIKQALLMQQVGGCTAVLPDGSISRGEMHMLLVGDPSMGKSVMLQFISKLSPRCVMSAGGGASGVGITASVVKDEREGWVLEGGVLPMANGGIAIVDEFDKLGEDDKGMLHEALEQLEIHIDKAGIHALLPTKCAVLAAANPKMGRFDVYEPLAKQTNLTPSLLSRFDLIFAMLDKPDPERDELISKHILDGSRSAEPPLTMEFIRKFILYARKLNPQMTVSARNRIQQYYISIRKRSINDGSVMILPRALQSIRRLAEANAKLRLSQEVTEDDAIEAITVYEAAFYPLISTRDGGRDIDILELGNSQLFRDRTKVILTIIRDLSAKGGATIGRIVTEADQASIPRKDAIGILANLKKRGDIMEIKADLFTIT